MDSEKFLSQTGPEFSDNFEQGSKNYKPITIIERVF
jgi:hypothetical protein